MNYVVNLDAKLAFSDVNGDGRLDLVYTSGDIGNGWTLHQTRALTIDDDGGVSDLEFVTDSPRIVPTGPVDIDGDGDYEWVALDASWELQGFCHACSPDSLMVLAWTGTRYTDASPAFGDYIVSKRSDPARPSAGATCYEVDSYLSQLVSRFLDYSHAGRPQEAARMLHDLKSFEPIGTLAGKREAIARILESGLPQFPDLPYDIGLCP